MVFTHAWFSLSRNKETNRKQSGGKRLAYKQALRMGYSKSCFRIARLRARNESLQWSLYDLSIYVQLRKRKLLICQLDLTHVK